MWGRIANIAAQADARFGGEEDDGSQSHTEGGATSAEESGAVRTSDEDQDEDGWGDDDDFDDDFDFGDDDDPDVGGESADNGPDNEEELVTATEGLRVDSTGAGAGPPAAAAAMNDGLSEGNAAQDDIKEKKKEGEEDQTPSAMPRSPPQTTNLPDMVTVSAPGKALVAGGYLVLESPNPGVVLAAEGCRFHTTIAFRPPYSEGGVVGNSVDASWESIPLDVYSPQFDRVYCYYMSYSLTSNEDEVSLRLQPRTSRHEPNKFVERSLLLALGYLRQSLGAEAFHARFQRQGSANIGSRVALAVKLRADNDFYSQINRLKELGLQLTPNDLEQLEPFQPCPKDPSTGELVVNKTGMGSSAALVTSVVSALLQFFGAIALPSTDDSGSGTEKEGLRLAHNLSQICHCYAQGKVGSGFDVSSAVYGSHIYTRFSKSLIKDFMEGLSSEAKGEAGGLQLSGMLSKQLAGLVNDAEWDCTVKPISLPPGLELLMADVCGGSESPSMARKILEWKKNRRKTGFLDDYYWKDLKRCNNKIVSLLSDKFTSQTFRDGLRRDGAAIISTRTAEQWKKPMPSSWYEFEGSSWDVALQLLDLRMAILECRQNLKGMGNAAGVPVEPDEQSALADATMKLPGVVAAGVPGAGGYDALFVLYVKGPETNRGASDRVRDETANLWRDMSDANNDTTVCPLTVRAAAGSGGLCCSKLDW